MQMLRAEDSLAARARTAPDEVKATLADVALGLHFRARKDANEAHYGESLRPASS